MSSQFPVSKWILSVRTLTLWFYSRKFSLAQPLATRPCKSWTILINLYNSYGAANFSTNSVLFAQPTPTLDSPDKGSKGGEVKNTSFVTNMFRGVTHTEQVKLETKYY